MKPFPAVTFPTACVMLGTRSLQHADAATSLNRSEHDRFRRLLAVLRSATNRTGEGYVGVLWTMIRVEELGGRTAIEALRTKDGARAVANMLRRRQDELAR